jgi:hypothetical protein
MTSGEIFVVKLPLDESPRWRWRRLLLTVGLTSVIYLPGFALLAHDIEARRTASNAFWRIEGTPCATLPPERSRDLQLAPRRIEYDGVIFERDAGAVACTLRNDRIDGVRLRYPVCKFAAPDHLAVSVAGQERLYDMADGRAATVSVVNGQVWCVLSEKFEL